jgi:hypothetical protein
MISSHQWHHAVELALDQVGTDDPAVLREGALII